MKRNHPINPLLLQKKPWNQNNNSVWLASTVSLQRNIEKFKFPGKLDNDRKRQIISLICKELLSPEIQKSAGLINPILIKAEDVGMLEKEFLVEHFLKTDNFNQTGAGEGFVLDESGEFFATLNMQDHVFLQLTDCRGELENIWNRLVKIETRLGKGMNYSFVPKYGFLTADPTECGTGLIATVYLQLAALVQLGKIDDALDRLADESLLVSGIQGSPSEIIGDIIVVQNTYTLGVTEENIISSIRNFTTKIMVEELSLRRQIKKDDSADFKDKISRAYGILVHSYQIEAIEALNALSLLKLGAEAGWISGIGNKEINELLFTLRRAHLLSSCEEKVSQEEVLHKRAESIHLALKNVKLLV